MGNNVDIKFEGLKTALKMVYSSESAILNLINNKQINLKKNKHKDLTNYNSILATYGGYVSEEKFPCILESDTLGDVNIHIYKTYILLNYKKNNYRLDKGSLMVNEYEVDISDVDTKQDMFSFSTLRDFYDLDYDDIERTKHIYKVLIEAADKARNA
ncbi:hypothetical protein XaC1_537 [Xanthomonas phage XaC1]|nr:hypothetical protein XaC1_537 [Xanthomonas phage XaC1]